MEDSDPEDVPSDAPAVAAPEAEIRALGVFLEEIAFFLEDMDRDLWWLLRMAHQPKDAAWPPPIVRGDEELRPLDEHTEALIERLRERAEVHLEAHPNQVRAKITIIPAIAPEEKAALHALRNLKFHCKGKIEVFPCMKEANNTQIWTSYFKEVGAAEPQWMLKTDGPGQKTLFSQCVIVVPVYIDRGKQEIKLFNVWCPEKKKRHWAFPGGDILRGTDRSLYDAARREFQEEVGVFFGRSWSDCFVAELPQDATEELNHPCVCLFVQLEKDGVRYPTRPYFFVQVKEEFYAATRCYEDASGVIHLPQPDCDYVKWDDLASARRVHLDGARFIEHDEARWVSLEFSTGRIIGDDTKQLRKENADLFRQQPERVWQWLADLTGLDPGLRSSLLPEDFEGPFAVRLSGVDKKATDEDIATFFSENSIPVKAVEQFELPRHTARVDFHDRHALEQAMQMSGRTLCRRKVKVELWAAAGASAPDTSAVPGARPLKPYDGPLPDAPPYRAIVRSLDKSADRDAVGYFFWDRDCKVTSVEFIPHERHAAVVGFEDVDSLRKALSLNLAVYKGREIQIDLPTARDERPSGGGSRGGGGGGGGGGSGAGRGRKGGGRGGGGDGFGGRDRVEREPPSRAEFGSERPRLQLQPRTKPLPGEPGYREEQERASHAFAPSTSGSRTDPFGGARPRDDRFRPTRADGDDNWRR